MSIPMRPDDPLSRLGTASERLERRVKHLESLERQSIPVVTGYRLLRVVVLTTADTEFIPSSNATALFVEGVAGGGGGGGCLDAATNAAAAGGGGGGAYGWVWITGPLAASYPVSVGTGGPGGPAGNNTGTAGGDTTFGVGPLLSLENGAGGAGDTVTTIHVGGQGGRGGRSANCIGDFVTSGQAGWSGFCLAAAQTVAGGGGASHFGGGARGDKGQGAGTAATGYGGGGSGGSIASSGGSVAGGDGFEGVLIVWEFTSD